MRLPFVSAIGVGTAKRVGEREERRGRGIGRGVSVSGQEKHIARQANMTAAMLSSALRNFTWKKNVQPEMILIKIRDKNKHTLQKCSSDFS